MMIKQAARKSEGGEVIAESNNIFPDLLTEEELIEFLRIPEVSKAKDHHNVIENLKRMHGLPRIHICGKPLYPIEAVKKWVEENTIFKK
jgi:hypothetical protein